MLRLLAAHRAHPLDPGLLLDRSGSPRALARPTAAFRGSTQRLSFAMAIVGRPELVFLDEPTAGLDVQARRPTWELVELLRERGRHVVLTTHAMDEAERLADHVRIIDRGQLSPPAARPSSPGRRGRATALPGRARARHRSAPAGPAHLRPGH